MMDVDKALARAINFQGKYLGLWELAEVLNLTKQATHNRRFRGTLPPAAQELKMGPLWTKKQIILFLAAADDE